MLVLPPPPPHTHTHTHTQFPLASNETLILGRLLQVMVLNVCYSYERINGKEIVITVKMVSLACLWILFLVTPAMFRTNC